ncbi:hypothetical protein L207DRAFT_505867 [Hyaloscypha variabilis F]|uniref:F-box domain-containing protein n=1 Tax=Hyaloscypha variabilis (strain UAMH 11265 / GT02V1 / F) TaxID=1149755 RepID=A0A2J6SDK0_HYAVF|nr:hypothetical protein L207DRAFT_505867 [Hyaloscypha variabilis F]
MDSLPAELLNLILLWNIRMSRCEKNTILPLRLVCKAFNEILKPYVFKTIQLEFSRFLRQRRGPVEVKNWDEEGKIVRELQGHGSGLDGVWGNEAIWKLRMDREGLRRVGGCCEALYLDLMVVRDEEEIIRLSNVFQGLIPKVPEMVPLLASLRRYCMNESTFDETDFREVLENVLDATPNMRRLKLNLPFQVVGQQSRTATLLLATTMAALIKRPEESKVLDTLVLDHVSDTTMIDICNNPMDLGNAIKAFSGLKHLVLSIKRQEARDVRQAAFTKHLWFLIRKAVDLESLCLIGWNVKRDIATRTHLHGVSANLWNMRSLPFHVNESGTVSRLRFLELKRVDIDPHSLINLVMECARSLKELYLNEVYLKVGESNTSGGSSLWLGQADLRKADDVIWVAQDLRKIEGLKLDVLRATGLGYDEFDPESNPMHPYYDLVDYSGRNEPFDQRFVEAVLELNNTNMKDGSRSKAHSESHGPDLPQIATVIPELTNLSSILPPEELDDTLGLPTGHAHDSEQQEHGSTSVHSDQQLPRPPLIPSGTSTTPPARELNQSIVGDVYVEPSEPKQHTLPPLNHLRKEKEYDAETFQRFHNTTSHFKRCIDGYFFNHNEQALKELQNIITVADRGMTLLSAEIDRARYGTEILTTP